jgi:phospholipid/cholesterol/gamma-HCH transport system ATP-binding protein
MIKINNLHKAFGPKQVLSGVDLVITPGDTICIIGKSGCGKSVLLKHIVGLLDPDQGNVIVNGVEVATMKPAEIFNLRKQIGYVFQGAALFDSMTVYENTIIGLYEHGERDHTMMENEAIRVLSAVGLLPPKDEVCEEEFQKEWAILKFKKPADLSGGMRKRVGVARALVGSPKFVFYDEPTTGLDPVTSEQIDALIEDLTKKMNVTSVVITHDMFSVFKVAQTVALLDQGKVRFFGTVDELRSTKDPQVVEFLERYEN